ncbi:hypothetical protein VC279_05960 [Xanthomonas sp. WHRI 10064A]|uniref:hypothetical protein n=1 Tax=unclassified Xanthomonas TaxID=2643310 RepID=UPI002B23C33B|nr:MULTISPECIES: hypothetical protein [unclassified Xanthomonas]MEA9585857.1 hypothetical protein [Xanthomonas sp. WHRI 10064B]MEA9614284.1 hypothetical protein [Xanthomonas sp. WHRI 10064A]
MISVRSCDEHNSKKSKDDEYFRGVFLSSNLVDGNPDVVSQRQAHERALVRAIERAASQIQSENDRDAIQDIYEQYEADPLGAGKVIQALEEKQLLRTGLVGLMNMDLREEQIPRETGGHLLTTSFAFNFDRLRRFMDSIARALLFHETGCVWKGRVIHFPHSFLGDDATEMEKQDRERYATALIRDQAKGLQKTIFYYDIFSHADEVSHQPNGYAIGYYLFDAFHFTTLFIEDVND